MSRVIVVGDVHGCLEELRELVDKVGPGSDDRVLFLGDFLDKGPDGAQCVAFVRQNGFEAVKANHEEKHLRWRKHEDRRRENPKYVNPMRPLGPRALAQNALLSDEDVAWLRSLPAYSRFAPGWVAVHGGVLPGLAIEDQDEEDLLRTRWIGWDEKKGKYKPIATDYDNPGQPKGSFHWTEKYDQPENIVVGHEAHSLTEPLVRAGKNGGTSFCIDTGCVHGGRLTALVLDPNGEVSFVQVQARDVYDPPHFPIPRHLPA